MAMAQPSQRSQAFLTAMVNAAPTPIPQLFRLTELSPLPTRKQPPTYPLIARSLMPLPTPVITAQQQTTARQTLSRIQSYNALPAPKTFTPMAYYFPQLATNIAQATPQAATELAAQTPPTESQQPAITLPPSNLSNLEELLLAFQLDDTTTPNLISAYLGQNAEQAGQLYLPLGAVSKALGLPIQVNPAQGTAKGWVVTPNRTFELNDLNNTITLQGKTQQLPPGSTLRTETDILVSTQQLQQWLPATFGLTLDTMVLSAYSTEILPETARLARQKIWNTLAERAPEQNLGQIHTLPRSWLGWPSLKAEFGSTYGRSTGQTTTGNNLNLQAQGPMAGMDGLLTLGFQQGTNIQRTFTGGTFRLEKTATLSETLLGPLQARKYELGDVNLPRIALMPTAGQGRGVALTNKGAGFAGSLSQFELQGPGPQGWDVEVYQNDNLLTFGTVANDGRYRFTNLNLRPGLNTFRVVLYGPQGEKQESTQNFTLGENLVKPGEWVYEAGVLESQNPVITTGNTRQSGVPTLVLNSFYGINRNLTLNLGVAQGPMGAANQTNSGGNLGLRAAYGRSFTQADVSLLTEGDIAATLREKIRLGDQTDIGAFATRLASSTLVAGQSTGSYGMDFTSQLPLDKLFQGQKPLRYGLTFQTAQYEGRDDDRTLTASQNWQLGRLSLGNTTTRQWGGSQPTTTYGTFNLTAPLRKLPLRAEVQYNNTQPNFITSAGLSTQMYLEDDEVLNLQASYQPPSNLTTAQASLQRNLGPLTLGLQGSWQSNNTFQVGANVGVQFAPYAAIEPAGGEPVALSTGPSYRIVPAKGEGFGYAVADVVTFIDENNNTKRDSNEELVPNVEIANLRSGNTVTTNAAGTARITALLPNSNNTLEVVESTLPSLNLKPANPYHTLIAQGAGYSGKVEIPLLYQAELIGQLTTSQTTPNFATLQLTLTNSKGEVLETTAPDAEGLFSFQPVPTGTYTITAKNAQGQTRQITHTLTKQNLTTPITIPTP